MNFTITLQQLYNNFTFYVLKQDVITAIISKNYLTTFGTYGLIYE